MFNFFGREVFVLSCQFVYYQNAFVYHVCRLCFCFILSQFCFKLIKFGSIFFFLKTWATLGGNCYLTEGRETFMTCSRKIFDVYAYTSPMKFSEQCDWHTQMFAIQASLPDKDLSHLAVH